MESRTTYELWAANDQNKRTWFEASSENKEDILKRLEIEQKKFPNRPFAISEVITTNKFFKPETPPTPVMDDAAKVALKNRLDYAYQHLIQMTGDVEDAKDDLDDIIAILNKYNLLK